MANYSRTTVSVLWLVISDISQYKLFDVWLHWVITHVYRTVGGLMFKTDSYKSCVQLLVKNE